ncbi:hypothetical protein IWX76_000376 [Pedobacter sp. CAN_A7]|uniref:DUF5694 domain-containing protein n=1 Tax=Pedobacter sp. CAN_A7 TaxID=2787722 RepID=UPI0018CAA8A8
MRFIFLLLLFLSLKANAQKIDILLIGASHNYSNAPVQDFSNISSKIKKFKPHAFFGEFLSKEDERLIMDYWCKPQNIKRLEMLSANRSISTADLPKTIDSLTNLIFLHPKDYKLKTDLAHAYYLNQDVANGHYQFWQVYNHLRQTPNTDLEKYVDNILSPPLDTTGRSMKRLKTSEYANIAFPIMLDMKIQELLPMDCQSYDLNWSAAALAFYNKFERGKTDAIAANKNDFIAILNKRDNGFKKYGSIEKNSQRFTEWLNTDEASAILASGDFYFRELYEIKDFPKEEMLSQIHWWTMRNKGMCDNVIKQASSLGLKKVVVIVGANHRKYMQDIFEKMPNVTVQNINEY